MAVRRARGLVMTRTCLTCGQRGHLLVDCPSRANGKSRGEGGKENKKGKGTTEKGKKGDNKGKPKGKRATEFHPHPHNLNLKLVRVANGLNQRSKMAVVCHLC